MNVTPRDAVELYVICITDTEHN